MGKTNKLIKQSPRQFGKIKNEQIRKKQSMKPSYVNQKPEYSQFDQSKLVSQYNFSGSKRTGITLIFLLVMAQTAEAHEKVNSAKHSLRESGKGFKNVETTISSGFALKAAEVASIEYEATTANITDTIETQEVSLSRLKNVKIRQRSSDLNVTTHADSLDSFKVKNHAMVKPSGPAVTQHFFAEDITKASIVVGDEVTQTIVDADLVGSVEYDAGVSVDDLNKNLDSSYQEHDAVDSNTKEHDDSQSIEAHSSMKEDKSPSKQPSEEMIFKSFLIENGDLTEDRIKHYQAKGCVSPKLTLLSTLIEEELKLCSQPNSQSYYECHGIAKGLYTNEISVSQCAGLAQFFKSDSFYLNHDRRYAKWQRICQQVENKMGFDNYCSGILYNFLYGDPANMTREIGVIDIQGVYIPSHSTSVLSRSERESRILKAIPSHCSNTISLERRIEQLPWNKQMVEEMLRRLHHIINNIRAGSLTHPDYSQEEFLDITTNLYTAMSDANAQTLDRNLANYDEFTDRTNNQVAYYYEDLLKTHDTGNTMSFF